MAVIDHIDGINRRIYLDISTMNTDVHPIDIYKEMRTLRRTDENLRKYDLFMKASGNIPKTPTTATERYVTCLNGTKIIPWDADHVLTIIGTIITDAGQSGVDCFDRSLLSPTTVVDINYIPPQVEIIYVTGGGGDWDPAERDQIRSALGIDGDKTAAVGGQLQDVSASLARALGMMQENFYIDNTVYYKNKLTSGRIRIYSDSASVGTAADVIATYDIAVTYNGDDMQTYKVVKA